MCKKSAQGHQQICAGMTLFILERRPECRCHELAELRFGTAQQESLETEPRERGDLSFTAAETCGPERANRLGIAVAQPERVCVHASDANAQFHSIKTLTRAVPKDRRFRRKRRCMVDSRASFDDQ